jgi:putative oxidoreductase
MTQSLSPLQRQGNWAFATSLGLLIFRILIGALFVYSGYHKVFGGVPGFAHSPALQHLPVLPPIVWAWMAALGEFLGGIFVLLGLFTRLAAVPLIVVMIVAILTVHGRNGLLGTPAPGGGMNVGYFEHLAIIAICLQLILSGAGLVSLDALFFKRSLWSRGPQPLNQPLSRR